MLNYIIVSMVPLAILSILVIGIKEKKDIFSLFINGALDGLKTVYNIFPYILAITIAINLLKDTGAMQILLKPLSPILIKLGIPDSIIPLCIMRPLSGGASMSIVMDVFNTYGPDSTAGKIASILMGATETTLYSITILFGAVGIKKLRGTLIAGLLADTLAVISTLIIVLVFLS